MALGYNVSRELSFLNDLRSIDLVTQTIAHHGVSHLFFLLAKLAEVGAKLIKLLVDCEVQGVLD
jgi:hypothetical protein